MKKQESAWSRMTVEQKKRSLQYTRIWREANRERVNEGQRLRSMRVKWDTKSETIKMNRFVKEDMRKSFELFVKETSNLVDLSYVN